MPQHAALVAVNILTAGKLRDFFVMGCSAGHVLQEGVSFARKCGTCFSFMLELAKIQIAMCRGAGMLWIILFWHPGLVHSPNIFVPVHSIVSAITPVCGNQTGISKSILEGCNNSLIPGGGLL
jgi:hypothetical protein